MTSSPGHPGWQSTTSTSTNDRLSLQAERSEPCANATMRGVAAGSPHARDRESNPPDVRPESELWPFALTVGIPAH